jgi:NADH-quinone oxidoreductase subunit G
MADGSPAELRVTIDGRLVAARPGEMVIEAAERAGTYIPRFCYHPRMSSVGVCRMCLVEIEGPRGATLQPACFVAVSEGMTIETATDKVKKAQDGVLEFLLANHPLDCPVCDKGGECPLQDQTLTHGSGETRFVEEKRHFAKPIEIGALVLLDRERCIQCARCTRFAAEVAGEAEIDFAGRGEMLEVAPFPSEPFDSVFSGNTVQICPVGALTAKPYRFTARPWDLEQVESSCTTCAVQCRAAVQSSGGRLTRVLGVDSDPVNHGWLCDKGRFAIEAVDAGVGDDPLDPTSRIAEPLVRRDGELEPATWGEALAAAASIITESTSHDPSGLGAIGGAALTNEGAFAWERLLRQGVGTDSLDAQYGDGLDPALIAALPRASIDEAARARVIVTICGDLREELPILFLRLRGALVGGRTSLVELAVAASSLRPLARVSLPTRPGEAHLVVRALAGDDAAIATLGTHPQGAGFSPTDLARARDLVGDGDGVVVVIGRANLSEDGAIAGAAARALAGAWPRATFLPALRRGNVMGALDMGLSPGLRPGRSSAASQCREGGGEAPATGRNALAQLRALAAGDQRAVVLLGGGLSGNVADVALVRAALERARVICVTGHGGPDLRHADVVLPASVAHERSGTVTNIEGRVTALAAKVVPPGAAWNDVAIATELAEALGHHVGLDSIDRAAEAIESTTGYPAASVLADPLHEGVLVGHPSARSPRRALDPMAFPGIRSAELVGPALRASATAEPSPSDAPLAARVTMDDVPDHELPNVGLADGYALRVVAARRLYDDGAAVSASPALRALVGPTSAHAHPYDLDRLGVSTGDLVRVVTARSSFELAVTTDPAVIRGTVELAVNCSSGGPDVVGGAVIDADSPVVEVRLEST